MDLITTIIAICVAGYAAIAIDCAVGSDLGIPFQQIRGAALAIAVVIAALIATDFFGRRSSKAK